jgi:hypothetical protein
VGTNWLQIHFDHWLRNSAGCYPSTKKSAWELPSLDDPSSMADYYSAVSWRLTVYRYTKSPPTLIIIVSCLLQLHHGSQIILLLHMMVKSVLDFPEAIHNRQIIILINLLSQAVRTFELPNWPQAGRLTAVYRCTWWVKHPYCKADVGRRGTTGVVFAVSRKLTGEFHN